MCKPGTLEKKGAPLLTLPWRGALRAVGCDAVRCVSPASPIQRLERQAQRYLGQFAWRTLSLRLDQLCISAGPNRGRVHYRLQNVVEERVPRPQWAAARAGGS